MRVPATRPAMVPATPRKLRATVTVRVAPTWAAMTGVFDRSFGGGSAVPPPLTM